MNNKLLISALLTLLSGCATTDTSSSLTAGTGSGAVGTVQKSTSQTVSTTTYPSYSSKPSFPINITENSSPSPAVLNQPQSTRSARTSYPDAHALSSKKIKVELIRTNSHDKVYLQLGVFSSLANAKMLQKKVVANQMPEPIIKEVILNGKLAHCVQLGPILSTAKVNEFNAKLAKIGISETWYVTENKL